MIEFKLPDLGENIENAEVLKLLVAEGDRIEKEQPVVELETDKASFEVPCPHSGTVRQIRVKAGDSVKVGQTILTVEEDGAGEAAPKARAERRPAPKDEPAAVDRAESKKSESRAAAKKKAEPKPAPADGESESEEAEPPRGAEARQEREAQSTRTGAEEADEALQAQHQEEQEAEEEEEQTAPESEAGESIAAGPATRRLARELGVDLKQIRSSGAGGRITADDVKAFVRDSGAPGVSRAAPPLPDFERWGAVERRKLNKLGRTAAERLTLAWRTVPHVTQHDFADITELEAARSRYESGRGKHEPKLTVTVLAIKAAVAALKTFPHFNSSFDAASGEVILKRYYHIGVAVDTEHGLLVPVLKDADQKSTRQLAAELDQLARRARERKLSSDAMQGGTFTITNLGGIGGSSFTPIVNYPEVAILGLSRAHREPSPRGSASEERLMLPLSLSYDHRVINGADAARFVRQLVELLQDPLHLLMES